MNKKKLKYLLISLLTVLIVYITFKVVSLFTLKLLIDQDNVESFNKWYKIKYLPSAFMGKVFDKRYITDQEISIRIYKFNEKEFISYRLKENENKHIVNSIYINDTIKKVKDFNKIYLIENGKYKDTFRLKFLYKVE